MSEFNIRHNLAALTAAAAMLAPSALAEGCDTVFADAQTDISRCYDEPLPAEYQPTAVPKPQPPDLNAYPLTDKGMRQYERDERNYESDQKNYSDNLDPYSFPSRISLNYNSYGGVDGSQQATAAVVDKVAKGVVKITTNNGTATGFTIENSQGNQVVITAAHVIGTSKMSQMNIINEDGQTISPIGGCYVYEDVGKFADLATGEAPDNDLAVLVLPHDIVKQTDELTTEDNAPQRGQWTEFVNYQANYEPGNPVSYAGIVLATPQNKIGYSLLTGLQPLPLPVTQMELDTSELQAGASGGPIVDIQTGAVVGVSASGPESGYYNSKSELSTQYSTDINGTKLGDETGVVPVVAGAMSPQLINDLLTVTFRNS